MNIFKYLLILILFLINAQAEKLELTLMAKSVKNANVLLLTANANENNKLFAILNDKKIEFNAHPFRTNKFYALVPFHYFMEEKKHQLIVTYSVNEKEFFEGYDITLEQDSYLSEEIKVSNSKVSLSKKNKLRTSKEYQEAINVYNSVSPKNYWFEDFIYPLDSKITSPFGTKRVYNNATKSYHTGIDFKAPLNTKIKASNNGVVKISKNRFYAGNSIIIDHGHGIYTCYFHLNKMFVSVGDFVQKGDIIGLSGSTGRSTGPHLHFATFVNGVQINPTNLLETLNTLN
ncbi:hypothetical protein A9Q76_03705 [Arcobacter sp. 31_11_sub10_T18]|nr:hypothetical protein A9Q76_03705 [Arcobacter sp. 31_11_sub10_T18]